MARPCGLELLTMPLKLENSIGSPHIVCAAYAAQCGGWDDVVTMLH